MTEKPKTLEEAAEMLETITPEEYLHIMDYVQSLERNIQLPEAPNSLNFRVSMPDGSDVQLTLRDMDEDALLLRFERIRQAMTDRGAVVQKRPEKSVQPSQVRITSPDIDASVIDQDGVESFEVESLAYSFSGKSPYVNVRGGVWKKYGWKAWPEIIPADIDYGSWPIGQDVTEVPPEMAICFFSKTKKKVLAFAAKN